MVPEPPFLSSFSFLFFFEALVPRVCLSEHGHKLKTPFSIMYFCVADQTLPLCLFYSLGVRLGQLPCRFRSLMLFLNFCAILQRHHYEIYRNSRKLYLF